MTQVNLVYFQHDLRVDDHPSLTFAQAQGLPILGVYILPKETLQKTMTGLTQVGPYRLHFLFESLLDLKTELNRLGIPLLIFTRPVLDVAQHLLKTYDVKNMYAAIEPGTEERAQLDTLVKNLANPSLIQTHDKPLLSPTDYPWLLTHLPPRFTDARMKIESNIMVQPLQPSLKPQTPIVPIVDDLETFRALINPNTKRWMQGGANYAKQHLHDYFFESQRVLTYKLTRNNLLAFADSSKLSPALSLGLLSPRYLYWQLKKVEATLEKNQSTYWLWFELLWRDYFYYLHLHHPETMFRQTGILNRPQPWIDAPYLQAAILEAKTGYPLVDANLNELYQTGWMSNRGRQNVASFMSKILRLDWRWGAALFEHYLIDYDVSSNYGNWQYISGVGTDPREDRIFNVSLQAKKYDPKGDYIRHWLPALRQLPTPDIFQPWQLNPLAMQMYQCEIGKDYPAPIVSNRRVQLND